NELPNAYYDLYRSALIEMGLALFGVTLLVNVAARALLWRLGRMGPPSRLARLRAAAWDRLRSLARHPAAASAGGPRRTPRAVHLMNRIMTVVLGGCLVVTVIPLFFVLGYILMHGLSGLTWDFFTKLPAPQGETGGGLANAIVGSLQLVGTASAVAVPIG